jgi:hypothetical protein
LARIQEYDSAKEALEISLNATDKLKDHISFVLDVMLEKKASSNTSSVSRSSLEINRSEMLVISKQIFYVLSSVLYSQGMFKEANEYLDRIESFIDEMCSREKELYSKILDELASNETYDAMSSSFTLEGTFVSAFCFVFYSDLSGTRPIPFLIHCSPAKTRCCTNSHES